MEIKTLKAKETKGRFFNPDESKKKRKTPKMLKVIFIIAGIIIVIGVLGYGAYYALDKMGYIQAFKIAVQYQKQTTLDKEDQQVLSQLKKIILLPDNITPSMAIINDIDTLKKQQPVFFADAKNNDRLIIYPNLAIIFDADANKIIKVGPVQTANTTETQSK
ncbi:MAG: Uncharacterized protein CEN87_260 [Parcubacteria group bacterium Licking1014_1]|nr:MAG: Uncharacterized protein CEN87_260 [Parcubacteria group bacterium Licking1014_1]